MGSEDLFHRKKAKSAQDLARKNSKRSSYEKVLIVCEGEKTEPNYFNELISHYKLNTANVAIDGTCGSSPSSVFNRAIEKYQTEKNKGDSYDRVYCLFDKDSHTTYQSTIKNIAKQNVVLRNELNLTKKNKIFHASTSVPCFEYWLLLHFHYTTRPYASTGTSSIADQVLKDLKKVMPYSKGDKNVFATLFNQLDFAKNNAVRGLAQAKANHTDNPTTLIHELVTYLQTIK